MKGRVFPVMGSTPMIPSALTRNCTASTTAQPSATRRPNTVWDSLAILNALQMSSANTAKNSTVPTNPSSSPMTARM